MLSNIQTIVSVTLQLLSLTHHTISISVPHSSGHIAGGHTGIGTSCCLRTLTLDENVETIVRTCMNTQAHISSENPFDMRCGVAAILRTSLVTDGAAARETHTSLIDHFFPWCAVMVCFLLFSCAY